MKMKKTVSALTAAMMLFTGPGISLADDIEPGIMLYYTMPFGEKPRVMKQKASFGLRADYDMRRLTKVAGYQNGYIQPLFDTSVNLKGNHALKLHGMPLNYSEGAIAGSSGDTWLKTVWQSNPIILTMIAVATTGILLCAAEAGLCDGDNNNSDSGSGSGSGSS